MLLDLGQPVPVESLQDISKTKEGLCAFIQPTPGQLLALNNASDWAALAWDGVSVSDIALRVDKSIAKLERKIQNKAFIDSARSWIKKQFHDIDELCLVNPPDNWSLPKRRKLDSSIGVLSLGCLDSSADIQLPLPGKDELCELRYFDKVWSVKSLSDAYRVELRGDPTHLRCDDEIQIHDLVFTLGRGSEVDEFYGIAKRLSVIDDDDAKDALDGRKIDYAGDSIEEYCRSLMYRQVTGELRVKSHHKSGSIYFYAGSIVHATAGAVNGPKALLRIMSWADATWIFDPGVASKVPLDSMRLDIAHFTRAVQGTKKTMEKVAGFIPPMGVSLKIVPSQYEAKKFWTIPETKVLASVGEYGLVRDILNYCSLPDSEIFETLIELRRQGLLLPVAQNRRNA